MAHLVIIDRGKVKADNPGLLGLCSKLLMLLSRNVMHDISPDCRWIAYVSEESGRPEVSVRNLFGAPTRIVMSASGGDQPVGRATARSCSSSIRRDVYRAFECCGTETRRRLDYPCS